MSLRYGMIGLLLALVFVLLIFKNYETWNQPIEAVPEKEMPKKQEKKSEPSPVIKDQEDPTSIKTYVGIADKNIFSPERKEFPVTPSPSAGEMKKPLSRPQVVLYGITIVGDYQSATVSTPGRPLKKGERETTTLKIGESVGEYKVSKILSDRIMMAAGEDSFEVLLHDPKMPKKRTFVKTESKPAAVVSATPPSPTVTSGGEGRPPAGAPGSIIPPVPSVPVTPTSPVPPTRRSRTPLTQSPGSPIPTTPSMTPPAPNPSAPSTSVPIPMTPPTNPLALPTPVPMAPSTPMPMSPSMPTTQGSGGP